MLYFIKPSYLALIIIINIVFKDIQWFSEKLGTHLHFVGLKGILVVGLKGILVAYR
jgi:hypothetical protein